MKKKIKIGDSVYAISSDDNYLEAMGHDFEPHMVELFRTLIGPEDVIADIGANIGLTAILFSSLAKKTFAFEPSPSTFRILSENLDINSIKNVEPVNLGFGRKQETLTITFAHNNRSGGYVSDKIRPETGHVTEEILIDTLDHYFGSRKPDPTFLKIDVEGFEQNVVQGGAKFMQRARPFVVMEMNHFCLDVLQRITIPDFLDFMRSNFPYLYAVDSDNTTIVDLNEPDHAYMVMHEHVVKHRFPNLVGGYDQTLKDKLEALKNLSKGNKLKSINSRKINALISYYKTSELSNPYGKIIALDSDTSVKAGSLFQITVKISNKGKETWHGYGDHPVHLSYHWKKFDGSFLIYDGIRTELCKPDLKPGEDIEQQVIIVAPDTCGKFILVMTLVQEGVCWFEDKGFEFTVLDIIVI